MTSKNVTTLRVPIQVIRELNKARKAIQCQTKGQKEGFPPRLYSADELAVLFGVDRDTILQWTRQRVIVPYNIPDTRKLFFLEEDIQKRIQEWKVK